MLEASTVKQLKNLRTLNNKTHNEINEFLLLSLDDPGEITSFDVAEFSNRLDEHTRKIFIELVLLEEEDSTQPKQNETRA